MVQEKARPASGPVSGPTVSVLLPVYNGAATLARTLDSLLAQTLPDIEILAVDDGSTDDTPGILAAYAARDARVRPIPLPHQGLVPALEAGLAHARAPYVARMDADDLCHPERLAKQAALLDERPDLGLVSCLVDFGGDRESAGGYARYVDWINTRVTPEQIDLGRWRESPLAHPSVMFRAELPALHGGYRDGDFPEDYELWLRWMEAGVRMAKVPEYLVTWNDPPDRLSRTDNRYSFDAFYAIKARYLARWLADHNPHHPEVIVMGAGRPTRKRADLLLEHGVRITAYHDIDPRKIGHVIHGRPVLHRDQVPVPGTAFALSYVASHGAAEDVTAFLKERGWEEGKDFLICA